MQITKSRAQLMQNSYHIDIITHSCLVSTKSLVLPKSLGLMTTLSVVVAGAALAAERVASGTGALGAFGEFSDLVDAVEASVLCVC